MSRKGAAKPNGEPSRRTSAPLHEQLRQVAALVGRVRRGQSLTEALPQVPAELRPGCQALAFHVLRWRGSAQAARSILAPRPPPAAVDDLLTCALSLLWPTPSPGPAYAEHTLVDETVRCAQAIAPRSAGFVNAVLRQFLRRRNELVEAAQASDEARWNHPGWWIRRLRRDWPEAAEGILQAAQTHPPMVLRAARRHGGLQALTPNLDAAGLAWQAVPPPGGQSRGAAIDDVKAQASPGQPAPPWDAVALNPPVPVQAIPGFDRGHWSVQDAAAQMAAPLLLSGFGPLDAVKRPLRVLDACSAPGGKTAHLLDLAPPQALDLLALDADPQRLQRVDQTLRRLGLSARLMAADARDVDRWWDGHAFDAVLLDAPCSASGIVRRHPDARWLKRDGDIAALAKVQAELLDALWPLVRPGGRLLYATCSVFKAEGSEQIDAFLQRHGLTPQVIDPLSPGHLLPLPDNADDPSAAPFTSADGFFYALLIKP